DVIRIGPNELHFAAPPAFPDIYNNRNRWDKDKTLYHSFGEDESSFGFLTHREAKERKDVLTRLFSPKAIEEAQGIVQEKVHALCAAFKRRGKPSDLFYAYRCVTMDVITCLCFGQSIDAVDEPDFKAPLVEAMHISTLIFPFFKHFDLYRKMIMSCPPRISVALSPETAGLIRMQQLLKRQIASHVSNPESLAHLPHSTTIYHLLLNPEAYRNKTAPTVDSLYDESQVLMFGGGDTTANVTMIGTFYLLANPATLARLKEELREAWPRLEKEPDLRDLERLPYLNAVIKESMRIGPGIPSGLPRIVPAAGAKIDGHPVPGGTIVSMSSWFVHHNESIYEKPEQFRPERWLNSGSINLEKWLVVFSKGPRSCLGMKSPRMV
ncbi:MAG: hypothetical protein M1830_006062, partial [Pleopsidium flavum]